MYAEGLCLHQVDFLKEINWAEHEYMDGSIADMFIIFLLWGLQLTLSQRS